MLKSRVFMIGLLVSGIADAQDFSDVTITTTKVADHIYMLAGRGGNIGLSVGADGVLMIDDQFAPLSDKIRKAIAALGGGAPRFLLNTHWHGDHTGGNVVFGKSGSTIIAQTNVRRRVSTEQKLFGKTKDPLDPIGWPIITFDDSLSIHFNGEEIRVLHLPHGHTDGDSVIFFTKSNVVHMGDDLFNGMFPFVDLDHGGDVEHLAQNVATVLHKIKPDTKVIPGHGPLSDTEGLRAFHAMLVDCLDTVRQQMAAGKTLKEIQQTGLNKRWDVWGEGFIKTDKWIGTIYKSLSNHLSSHQQNPHG